MERQKEKSKEVPKELKEKAEKELEELRNELARLRKLKKQKEQLEQRQSNEEVIVKQMEELETDDAEVDALKYLEDSFEKIEDLLSSDLGEIDHKAFKQQAKQIESELQILEEEIVGEEGLIVKELSPYEKLLQAYPWLEKERKTISQILEHCDIYISHLTKNNSINNSTYYVKYLNNIENYKKTKKFNKML